MNEQDTRWLRASFDVARRAAAQGNHPFGAVLVDADGNLLLEGENTVTTERDITGHAETNLVREAVRQFPPHVLANSTMYASTEPCAMCATVTFLGGIGRVVFGMSATRLRAMRGNSPDQRSLNLSCADVLTAGHPPVEVVGPTLEDEAAQVHAEFWK